MEILINKKWLKVDYISTHRSRLRKYLSFKNLNTDEKKLMEDWFATITSYSKEHKIDTLLIDDSKIFFITGIFIYSIGDSSCDFLMEYDNLEETETNMTSLLGVQNLGEIKLEEKKVKLTEDVVGKNSFKIEDTTESKSEKDIINHYLHKARALHFNGKTPSYNEIKQLEDDLYSFLFSERDRVAANEKK